MITKELRVKTRAIAVALKDFIKNSDKVIFMGHSGADYDCFGAAVGFREQSERSAKSRILPMTTIHGHKKNV